MASTDHNDDASHSRAGAETDGSSCSSSESASRDGDLATEPDRRDPTGDSYWDWPRGDEAAADADRSADESVGDGSAAEESEDVVDDDGDWFLDTSDGENEREGTGGSAMPELNWLLGQSPRAGRRSNESATTRLTAAFSDLSCGEKEAGFLR